MELATRTATYRNLLPSPKDALSNIPIVLDGDETVEWSENGGVYIKSRKGDSPRSPITAFLSAVKSHRLGGDGRSSISIPADTKYVSYVDVVDYETKAYDVDTTATAVIFKFNGCEGEATAYSYGDVHCSEMSLPPFYFAVEILPRRGREATRRLMWWSNGKGFINTKCHPHANYAGRESGWTEWCFGGMGDQIATALSLDDMGMLMDVFTSYMLNGTDVNDSYGNAYEQFVPTATGFVKSTEYVSIGSTLDLYMEKLCMSEDNSNWLSQFSDTVRSSDGAEVEMSFKTNELRDEYFKLVLEHGAQT